MTAGCVRAARLNEQLCEPSCARQYDVVNRLRSFVMPHLPNLLKLRVVRFSSKLVYVAFVYALGFGVNLLLVFLKVPGFVEIWLQLVIDTAGVLYGARIFRGPNEQVEAPRPLYQMTATRNFSVVIGIFASAGLVLAAIQLILALAHPAAVHAVAEVNPYFIQADVSLVVQAGILVALYFNSAARLPRSVAPPQSRA
jgi:hypothetical protein